MTEPFHYETRQTSRCPGCGNFGILQAMKTALVALQKKPSEVLLIGGIGQAAKLPQYLTTNGLCTLHGRALPAATGAKVANSDLTIFVHSGDGDAYAEGGNHLIHTLRRDVDITLLLHNNQTYGLTQGQASPTSDPKFVSNVQPRGVINRPLRGLALALTSGCRFVARGFSARVDHLAELIALGARHRGTSFIEIVQPCISMNKLNTFAWYNERITDLKNDPTYDAHDRHAALKMAEKWEEQIPIGLFYEEPGTCFEERIPVLQEGPLVRRAPRDKAVVASLLREFL